MRRDSGIESKIVAGSGIEKVDVGSSLVDSSDREAK